MVDVEVKSQVAILILILCPMTAALSLFLQLCMEKGMIFRKWYNLITFYLWLPKKSQYKGGKYLYPVYDKRTDVWLVVYKNQNQGLFKILGGCVYCFGTWVFITFYSLISQKAGNYPGIIGLILGCGVNYLLIEIWRKIIK